MTLTLVLNNQSPNEPRTVLNIEVGNVLAFPDPEHAQHAKRDMLMYSLGRCADYFKAMGLLQKLSAGLRRRGPQGSDKQVDVNHEVLLHLCVPVSCRDETAGWGDTNSDGGGGGVRGRATDTGNPMNGRKDITLHPKQQEVIAGLTRPLELIHGPPGTGS